MKEFKFIAHGVVVKNNKGLKTRKEIEVSLEVERALFGEVIGLEAFEDGTHFEVTIKPKYQVDVDPDQTSL